MQGPAMELFERSGIAISGKGVQNVGDGCPRRRSDLKSDHKGTLSERNAIPLYKDCAVDDREGRAEVKQGED